MQDLSDEQVMLNYQKGEMPAMEELLRRYRNPIYHFAFRLSSDRLEAQDITQEVFLNLHRFRDTCKPTGKFSTWIFSIAHNLCVSRLRKKKWLVFWPRKQDDPDKPVDFISPDPSPQEIASRNELSVVLRECIQGLPFLQREALVLCEFENLNYQEITRILKKPLGTVKVLIHRARQNLKNKFLPYLEESKGGGNNG